MLITCPASAFVLIPPKERSKFLTKGIVPINDVFEPMWSTRHRYEVYYGSRGSSKTWFIGRKLLNMCMNDEYFLWLYCRKGRVDIKESLYRVLKKTIISMGKYHEFRFNESTLNITHIPTGNGFIARGMDDPEKSKGIDEISGIWFGEVTEFEQEDFVTANQGLRTESATLMAIVDFNPIHINHWVRHYFFSKEDPHAPNPELRDIAILRTTLWDNYFINREQYEQDLIAGASGNQNIIRVVVKGDWGLTENGNPWLHAFSEAKHVRKLPFMERYPVFLTFDINADPLSCTAWQMTERKGGYGCFLHCIAEFGGHIKIEDICNQIKTRFPASIFYVTGDRSGQNQDVGRNQTIYQMVQSLLHLSDKQMLLHDSNLEHADSRILCNAVFYHYPVLIDPSCKNLIDDCNKATVDMESVKGNQLKKDRKDYKMDYFDGMRYLLQKLFLEYITKTYINILSKKQ